MVYLPSPHKKSNVESHEPSAVQATLIRSLAPVTDGMGFACRI